MNVLDSRCSVLTSLVIFNISHEQIPNLDFVLNLPSRMSRYQIGSDTKLVNTLHLESNTFIYNIILYLGNIRYPRSVLKHRSDIYLSDTVYLVRYLLYFSITTIPYYSTTLLIAQFLYAFSILYRYFIYCYGQPVHLHLFCYDRLLYTLIIYDQYFRH